ncbi:DUF4079 domain-containing protein [Halodesulfovibrio sp.]|uniref:DUF4079 domain-containing protein n=1 Tax=Halodesulfovibrio sp. TaxID=1912772 RepID=UPI0025BC10B2|nr:DUF4079 domain-containing protein [Halodesulfovibrio sp.]
MFQEAKLHLYIHPAIQVLGIVFGYITLFWGAKRFLAVHRKKKFLFPWKSHVLYGKISIYLWLFGLGVGVYFTHAEWNYFSVTGEHYTIGIAILPLLLITFLTGYWMDLFKKKRQYLCLVHGGLGAMLCILVFVQVVTGVQVFSLFVW